MGLPNNIEARPKDEWMKLAGSSDPAQRKQVTDTLRALGLQAPDFMSWDAEKRVAFIMEKQGDAGSEKSGKDANTGKAADGGKASSGGGGGGGGGGMSDADRAMLRAMLKENNALLRKVHDLLAVLIFTDPKAKANAEELEVKVELLGNG